MANANGKAEAPAAAAGSEATEQGEAAAAAAASPAPHTRWVQRTGSVRLPFREPSASGEATDIKQLLSVAAASAFVGAAATAALFSTWVQRMKPPRLLYAPTAANAALLRAVPLLHRHYVPHLLAWNAHLAGVFGYFKLPVPRLFFERLGPRTERIVLSDGGSVSLLWSSPADAVADGAPILLLLPGINNDASMGYLQHVQALQPPPPPSNSLLLPRCLSRDLCSSSAVISAVISAAMPPRPRQRTGGGHGCAAARRGRRSQLAGIGRHAAHF